MQNSEIILEAQQWDEQQLNSHLGTQRQGFQNSGQARTEFINWLTNLNEDNTFSDVDEAWSSFLNNYKKESFKA